MTRPIHRPVGVGVSADVAFFVGLKAVFIESVKGNIFTPRSNNKDVAGILRGKFCKTLRIGFHRTMQSLAGSEFNINTGKGVPANTVDDTSESLTGLRFGKHSHRADAHQRIGA